MKSLWQKTETLQKIQMFINSCLRQHIFKIRWPEKVKMRSFGSQAQEPMEKTNPKALVGQRAKKVVSDSPGLVDFAIGLVSFVLNLPDGQVLTLGEIQIIEGL